MTSMDAILDVIDTFSFLAPDWLGVVTWSKCWLLIGHLPYQLPLLLAFPTFCTQTSRTKMVRNRTSKAIHSKKMNGLEREDPT